MVYIGTMVYTCFIYRMINLCKLQYYNNNIGLQFTATESVRVNIQWDGRLQCSYHSDPPNSLSCAALIGLEDAGLHRDINQSAVLCRAPITATHTTLSQRHSKLSHLSTRLVSRWSNETTL